jgi:fructoselysine-6-P-deglycase FrlB-like protein
MRGDMLKDFLDEVMEQGRALRAAAEAYRGEEARVLAEAVRVAAGRPLLLAGMGSSWAAALAVEAFLVRRGRLAVAVDASEALYRWLPVLNGPRTLAPVLISQSGESRELVRLASRMSCPFIAVTNAPRSTLGGRAAAVLPLHAGVEKGATNKTFLNTIAVGLFLGRAILADGREERLSEMARLLEIAEFFEAAAAIEALLSRSDGQVRELRAHLIHEDRTEVEDPGRLLPWQLIGRGSGMAAVEQMALILQELTGRVTVSFPSGLYRHGPIYRVSPSTRAIILAARDEEGELLGSLAKEIVSRGGRVAFVADFDPEIEGPLFLRFPLPAVARGLFPLVASIPLELLGVVDAEARAFDGACGVPKVTPVE